jgi:hypothetical protein
MVMLRVVPDEGIGIRDRTVFQAKQSLMRAMNKGAYRTNEIMFHLSKGEEGKRQEEGEGRGARDDCLGQGTGESTHDKDLTREE